MLVDLLTLAKQKISLPRPVTDHRRKNNNLSRQAVILKEGARLNIQCLCLICDLYKAHSILSALEVAFCIITISMLQFRALTNSYTVFKQKRAWTNRFLGSHLLDPEPVNFLTALDFYKYVIFFLQSRIYWSYLSDKLRNCQFCDVTKQIKAKWWKALLVTRNSAKNAECCLKRNPRIRNKVIGSSNHVTCSE